MLSKEPFAVLGRLVDDCLGLDEPADKDTGADREDRHQDIVRQIIEDIEDLSGTIAVRQLELKVQQIVAEADSHRDHCRGQAFDDSRLFALHTLVDKAGNDSLKKRYRAGQRGKQHHKEEHAAEDPAGDIYVERAVAKATLNCTIRSS